MRDSHCGPGFGWAFGRRPENFGFDAGAFWAGRGKSRGGPFGGGRMFDQGHLKFVILGLLAEKPRHGYEIIKEIEEGRLPHRKVGTHRRVAFEDLVIYAREMRKRQEGALERMAENARELGLDY